MSYEPTNWKTGDVVTSAKLNKLENGVANGSVMVVHKVARGESLDDGYQLDKTWQEIYDAFLQNDLVVLYMREEDGDNSYQGFEFIIGASYEDGIYHVSGFHWSGDLQPTYICTSPSEYPKSIIPPNVDPGVNPVG